MVILKERLKQEQACLKLDKHQYAQFTYFGNEHNLHC